MKILKKFLSLVVIAVLVYILILVYNAYKQKFFNDFNTAELTLHLSEFSRDKNVQYEDGVDSYKIVSNTMNDATFYKTLEVEKNTPYKVSCMVKTENVVAENNFSESGAHISIIDTVEKSESIQGTSDWQEIAMYFNSYGRESVNIGFRLGGFQDDCTGTAWFSNFKVEKGVVNSDSTWNVACFVIPNTDVVLDNGTEVIARMSENDIYNTKVNMQRFQNSCNILSGGLINIEYDYFETDETLTSISYDGVNGNYIAGTNVANIIDPYLEKEEYDHIFIVAKLGDASKNLEIEVNDWIGLGGMTYKGIGFSNIRIPSDEYNEIYVYNGTTNTFPEEVMVHEFLHDLERICTAMNYEIPALHDYKEYGYENEAVIGQRTWYQDYMSKKINDTVNEKYIGLEPEVYKMQPAKESDFEYSLEIEFIKEPENIIEELSKIFRKNYSNIMTKIEREEVGVLVYNR